MKNPDRSGSLAIRVLRCIGRAIAVQTSNYLPNLPNSYLQLARLLEFLVAMCMYI